jgi:hypothetical protein
MLVKALVRLRRKVSSDPAARTIRTHVFAAECIHADTTVPVLPKGKARTDRLRTYVRDGRPLRAHGRRRPCSSIRVIAAASILSSHWPALPG